jgi:hypothetical protein
MILSVDEQFLSQRREYNFLFTCEHCVHFDPNRVACVHGYPVSDHLDAPSWPEERKLIFCKEFDML